MIILRICGLLAMLVSIVPANPIMGDVDTTVAPLPYDMTTISSVREDANASDTEETDTKTTLAPSSSNEEHATVPATNGITSASMQDIPSNVTPVIAAVTDLFKAPTTTMIMDTIIQSTSITLTLPPTMPPTSPPTAIATPPTTPPTISVAEITTATTLSVTDTTLTMTMTDSNKQTNDIKQSDTTVPVALQEDIKTTTPPVTEIKLDSTKSPILENLPLDIEGSDSDDDINNVGALVTIPNEVDENSINLQHEANSPKCPKDITNNSGSILTISGEGDEDSVNQPNAANIPKCPKDTAINSGSILTIPSEVDENSINQPHDEVDNVLTLSSNEDTTRIVSSTDAKDSDKNLVVLLSAETEPTKSMETKNDEHGNSFASSIASSFIVLLSTTVLYVII